MQKIFTGQLKKTFVLEGLTKLTSSEWQFLLLRIGVSGCFIGHGFWGLVGKSGWLPFFEVFGISHSDAMALMPLVGFIDIAVGVLAFIRPSRMLLLWAIIWTIFTALLRPLADMGMSEFVERAGNYGIPLAFLLLYGLSTSKKEMFERLTALTHIPNNKKIIFEWTLRISMFMLLAGHGGLVLFQYHPVITKNIHALGIEPTYAILQVIGLFEMSLALLVLLKPKLPGVLLFVLCFKLFTESIFPFAGLPRDVFETIERMGDYIAPLLLMVHYRNN